MTYPGLDIRVTGALGHITLDRPKALHALDRTMCLGMAKTLKAWAADSKIGAVLIDHKEGTRGFCAGGDIRMMAESARVGGADARDFFRTEYTLNCLIHSYKKPYVALLDGITMGGGVGISVHGSFRVATENTVFAMPEAGIGLFPDVGGGWFLPRLKGEIGVYAALTGARFKAADCLYAGIATHYVPSTDISVLKENLRKAAEAADPMNAIRAMLDAAHRDPGAPALAGLQAQIDRTFGHESVEGILEALGRDGSDWAKTQAETLATKSPQTLKVSLRQIREGAKLTDFVANMKMEFRIASRVVVRHDFIEGVRAVMIDKDHAPKWNPARLADVTPALLEEIFAPLPPQEEFVY